MDKELLGESALRDAVDEGLADEVKTLIKEGADTESRNRFGESALHLASIESDQRICEILLEAGSDVNARDTSGMTPLHNAAGVYEPGAAYITIIKALLENGADVNARDGDGRTPLFYAKSKQSIILDGKETLIRDPSNPCIKEGIKALQDAGGVLAEVAKPVDKSDRV